MKALKFIRENILKLFILFALSGIVALLNLRALGLKDTAMLFLATSFLISAVYLAFKDKKKSILLFIVGFPFLVTARKAVYFDFLIFKVTYETIYVTILFLASFKNIKEFLKGVYYSKNKSGFNYFLYTAVFLIFALNSTTYSYSILRSIRYTYISVFVPVMFMLSVAANIKKEDINHIYDVLIIQNTLSCLYGFIQIFSGGISLSRIAAKRHSLTFGFHNVNIFAGLLVLILPIIIERFLREKDKKVKTAIFVAFGINMLALFITFTRGAWLAFLASVFVVGVIMLYHSKYRKAIWGVVVVGVLAIKPVLSYIVTRGTSTSLAANESTIARLQSLFTSIKIMLTYPFGAGAGTFGEMYKEFSIEGYKSIPFEIRNHMTVASYNMEAAHNLWLQIGTELGIVCAVVFLIIIINRFIAALRNFQGNRAHIGAIVAYLIFSVLTGVEFEHKGIIAAALVIWLIFTLIELSNRESLKHEKSY
jgi:O-antigen ligase